MSALSARKPREIVYPDSDGEPVASNTTQLRFMTVFKEGWDARLPDAFVAMDLFWYPVKGAPNIRYAPDVMVALGRPKGDRGSYKQWEEGGVAPQVLVEVLSPGNTLGEMIDKFRFYERYGVQEYYVYDPDTNVLTGWVRKNDKLEEIIPMHNWRSPLLGTRFVLTDDTLELYDDAGERFLTYAEMKEQAEQANKEKEQERKEKEQERKEKEQALATLEQLRAQLRAMGIEPPV